MIYFITSNINKFLEAKAIIPELEQLSLDLPEVQELDPKLIIEEKLKEAFKSHSGEFIVEDTSLYLDCLNGFPGPLIKWMLKSISAEGIFNLVNLHKNNGASAKTIVGYSDGKNIFFFEGEIKGKIVAPKGNSGFGWDTIFMPSGFKTFAEMSKEEKNKISMRKQAFNQLKEFLDSKNNSNKTTE